MKMQIRRSAERGHASHGWLEARHTFSFAEYHDPDWMEFRHLRVLNHDVVAGGGGFQPHPHKNMEIVTYMIRGALSHSDSMGNSSTIRSGEIQLMGAGTGVVHSEINGSRGEDAELLQIWIIPDKSGYAPRYEQTLISEMPQKDGLTLMVSPTAENKSLLIHQDVKIYELRLNGSTAKQTLPLTPERFGWLQLVSGTVAIGSHTLAPGDGAAFAETNGVKVLRKSSDPVRLVFFDLV